MLLFYCFILVFAGVITYRVFDEIFLNENDSFRIVSVGAFLGAFFAFLFIRFSDFISKISLRICNNYIALVRLQHYSNENISIIDDNIHLMNQIITQLNLVVNENKRAVLPINIIETSIEKEIILSITNLDFANQLFTYNMMLRKLNQSSQSFKQTMEKISNSYTSNTIPFSAYKLNVSIVLDTANSLKKYMILCLDTSKDILSTVRVLGKNKPFISWIFQKITKNKISITQNNLISKEKIILNKEIDEIKNESKKELKNI